MQWNCPTRTDYYLMLVATSVQRVLAKHPNKIKLEDNKLQFGKAKDRKAQAPVDRKAAAAISKAAWVGRMTLPVKHITRES
jgi:hypothetical protein